MFGSWLAVRLRVPQRWSAFPQVARRELCEAHRAAASGGQGHVAGGVVHVAERSAQTMYGPDVESPAKLYRKSADVFF
eukprot:750460-Hanusia_phi.AAC.1